MKTPPRKMGLVASPPVQYVRKVALGGVAENFGFADTVHLLYWRNPVDLSSQGKAHDSAVSPKPFQGDVYR